MSHCMLQLLWLLLLEVLLLAGVTGRSQEGVMQQALAGWSPTAVAAAAAV